MPPRRAHKKSRRGCLQCKRRRVKCDEQIPFCGNCTKRGLDCSYLLLHGDGTTGQHDTPGDTAYSAPGNTYASASEGVRGSASATPRPSSSAAATPASGSNVAEFSTDHASTTDKDHGQRLLDLELMHLYATSTYHSCVGMIQSVETDDLWRTYVPRQALRYGFLLDAILAFAAVHMASLKQQQQQRQQTQRSQGPRQRHGESLEEFSPLPETYTEDATTSVTDSTHSTSFYLHKALEYQNRAFASFRALQDVTPENVSAVFAFSILTMLIATAVPPIDHTTPSATATATARSSEPSHPLTLQIDEGENILYHRSTPMERILSMSECLKGVAVISGLGRPSLYKSPFRLILGRYADYESGNWQLKDPDTVEALKRLARLNEQLNGPNHGEVPHPRNDDQTSRGERDGGCGRVAPTRSLFEVYKAAITHLEWCFERQEPPAGPDPSTSATPIHTPVGPPHRSATSVATPMSSSTATSTATGPDRGHIVGWIAMAGSDFVTQLRRGDPLALLIFSHWAVLLDLLDTFWWSRNSARALVVEIADNLHARGPEWEERTRWARKKVGLL